MSDIVDQQTDQKKSKRGIFLGILILLVQLGMLFAYGFDAQFQYIATNSFSAIEQTGTLSIYFFMTMFAVGMGLILSYFSRGIALGLGTAIFTIALNIQLSPLLQKFWFNVFVGSFDSTTHSTANINFVYLQQLQLVKMSVFLERNAAAMTISYLIASLATIGRTGIFEVFSSLIVYNVMWPVPFYCNIKIFMQNGPASQQAFDDFGLTYIYTFAAFFGVVYSIFLNLRKNTSLLYSYPSKTSSILSILGTTVVFCTLPSTAMLYPFANIVSNGQLYNTGVLNVFFAEIAGVISCTIWCLIFGKGKFKLEQILVSVLAGPAIVAQIATVETNIAAFLTVGAFGGFIAAFWIQVLHPKLNNASIKDALGLIGSVLLPSLFGGIVFTPVLLRIYIDNGWQTQQGVYVDSQYIRFNYIYYFITVGAAVVGGVIAGIFSFCTKSQDGSKDFQHSKLFSPDFGLCSNPSAQNEKSHAYEQNYDSAQIILKK